MTLARRKKATAIQQAYQDRARALGCKAVKFSWEKVKGGEDESCWPWIGALNRWGYGACQWNGKQVNASRAAYESIHGKTPDGLVVCHSCDNPACCNPAHLFAATQAENLADCRAKGRTNLPTGQQHHRAMAKLTAEEVQEARRLYASGISQSEIGRRWGIHPSNISRAVRGKNWGHVK